MRQQVLKALANPARIFYVPYTIAVLNFAVQFIIFVVVMAVGLILSGGNMAISPMWFLVSVIIVHMILMGISKTEPQLANIITANLALFRRHMPHNLEV